MKSIFKSKTVWFNAFSGLVVVLTAIDPELLSLFGVTAENQVKVLEIVGLVTMGANFYLRSITKSAVSVSGK